ncbi:MAG: hybrid sensor histidine kinase/response regulator [Campylobacterales bacterium]|nr:hybrid sensor histidine kinase/response regulator [Campylobacterales bacterium]
MNSLIRRLEELAFDKVLLIVEDDPHVSQSLKRLLSHFFLTIYVALDSVDALDIYTSLQKGDASILVITDIHLGGQSGIDLARHIKIIDPDQKMIAISGSEERDVFIDLIRCGVERFILKPIEKYELFDALISILSKINYDVELKNNRELLESSREYALKLLDEQDQFLKNAIHEIHTPLAVIITNIDLLRLNGIENESLNAIEAGSRIIQNSYEDMTYLMKHDRIFDEKVKIDLVAFFRGRIGYFNCIAAVNEITISLRVGQLNLPELFFSELKLSRIIDNTLSNAIKYSYRPSEINIIIGLRKGSLFFEVRNRGPIIQDMQKIFERFHRESEHKGGYGLGLHIIGQICHEEEVEIEVSSSVIRGTCFGYFFKIPLNRMED